MRICASRSVLIPDDAWTSLCSLLGKWLAIASFLEGLAQGHPFGFMPKAGSELRFSQFLA